MRLKRIAAWGLAITMALGLDIPGVNAAGGVIDTTLPAATADSKTEQIRIATEEQKLPGTDRTFFDENDDIYDWFNVSGYAADGVRDRSEYYDEFVANGKKNTGKYVVVHEDGYIHKTTDEYKTTEEWNKLEEPEKSNYTFKSAEAQFIDAFDTSPKVIQVDAEELELGYLFLQKNGMAGGPITQVTDKENPITSPVLMETGLSDLNLYSHLTIFSTTGCIIRHAGINLNSCNDVIIRNFQFEGMYEWDEPSYNKGGYDSHKRFGWCNLTCNNSNDIWVDHCTFGFAFDGNIDLKNGSSVSVTWCRFGEQDLSTGSDDLNNLPTWNKSTGSELWKNILYMEECYQEYLKTGDTKKYFAEYASLRGTNGNGATPLEILNYAAFHSKVHLVGSGDKDFYTNVNEKISLGFNKYTRVIQRMPMVRSGNGHMYNCIVDNTEFQKSVKAIQDKGVKCAHFYSGYVSVNNARNGASIGTDTSIFKEVSPNCGGETQKLTGGTQPGWETINDVMINHNLTVNSKVSIDGKEYTGSSWDSNGENLFNRKWTWNDRSSIGDWKWSKWEGLDDFLNEGALDTNKIAAAILAYKGNLYRNYYVGQYELEYSYKCFNLDKVETMLEEYGGVQKSGLYGKDETPYDYIQPYNSKTMSDTYTMKVTINTNGGTLTQKSEDIYYLKAGETFTLPTKEDEIERYGYELINWKKVVTYYGENGQPEYEDLLAGEDGTVTITAPMDGWTEATYYAFWDIKTWKVTFDSMGGTPIDAVIYVKHSRQIRNAESGAIPTETPTKDGAEFLGWYKYTPETQTFGTSKISATTSITADTVFYAKWNNTITFNTDDGTPIADMKVNSGKTILETDSKFANPEKEGFAFVGWYTDENFTKPFDPKTDKVMDPMTLYAKFALIVTVSFDTGIEDEVIDSIEVVSGETGSAIQAVEPPKATDDAIEFGGWYYDEEFEEPFDPEAKITEDITLHAKWVRKQEEEKRRLGDVNGDKKINSFDALAVLQYAARIPLSEEEFNSDYADVDGNEKINQLDALGILQYAAGAIKDFSELQQQE